MNGIWTRVGKCSVISRLAGQRPFFRASGACRHPGFRGSLPAPPHKKVSDLLFKIRLPFPRFFTTIAVIFLITIVLLCENPNNQ